MNVCFVGTGSIGRRHIKNLVEVCKNRSIDLEIDVYRHSKAPLPNDIKDFVHREILSVDDLEKHYDMVFVANPTNMHYSTIATFKDLCSAFFIEKPLFESKFSDYHDFKLEDKKCYIACPIRHTSIFAAAKELLKNEKVYSTRAICSSYLPNWRPDVDYRTVYSANEGTSGGIRFDLIHEWDYLVDLFGFPKDVQRVSGHYSNLEIDGEDVALYIAKYHEMLLELHIDYFGKKSLREFEVFTENATWKIDIMKGVIEKDGQVFGQYAENPNDKYIREMNYFIDYVNGEKSNINTIENAWNLLQII